MTEQSCREQEGALPQNGAGEQLSPAGKAQQSHPEHLCSTQGDTALPPGLGEGSQGSSGTQPHISGCLGQDCSRQVMEGLLHLTLGWPQGTSPQPQCTDAAANASLPEGANAQGHSNCPELNCGLPNHCTVPRAPALLPTPQGRHCPPPGRLRCFITTFNVRSARTANQIPKKSFRCHLVQTQTPCPSSRDNRGANGCN